MTTNGRRPGSLVRTRNLDIGFAVSLVFSIVLRYRRLLADPQLIRADARRKVVWTAIGVAGVSWTRRARVRPGSQGAVGEPEPLRPPPYDILPMIVRLGVAVFSWRLGERLIGRRVSLSARQRTILTIVPAAGSVIDYAVGRRSRLRHQQALEAWKETRKQRAAGAKGHGSPALDPGSAGDRVRPDDRSVPRNSATTFLRLIFRQTFRRHGVETLLETSGSEADTDRIDPGATIELPRNIRLLPPKRAVALHASKWGTGLPLCESTATGMVRVKQPWGDEPGPLVRIQRCAECLRRSPLSH